MSSTISFQNSLAEALEKRKTWLDRTEIPRLKEEFQILQASFNGLYQVLLKKGVIHEDPYKNDEKIGELTIPPEGPFSESERIDQMSIRLSNFESQLDFLINFYQFSTDFLSMERIKRLAGLVKYFAWTNLSINSQNINTRTLVEIINMVKGGNDQLSVGLLADSIQHLEKSSKEIFKYLKEITDYHRENYKLELRIRFMDNLKFDSATVIAKKDETLRHIKRKFIEAMSDRPFYPELVEEVLKEDYSGEGAIVKEDLIKKLEIPIAVVKNPKSAISYKSILIDGLRILGTLSFTVDDIIRKIEENSAIIESGKNSFWDKLKRTIQQLLNKEPEALVYDVEFFDPILGSSKTEALNYTQFKQEVDRKARFLASFGNRNSNASRKLEAAEGEQILPILSKNLEEIQSMHKTLTALDEFYKTEVSREDRDKIRGIKPELSAIKNGIVKANQKRHEYLSHQEEQEQMKRLGIKEDN